MGTLTQDVQRFSEVSVRSLKGLLSEANPGTEDMRLFGELLIAHIEGNAAFKYSCCDELVIIRH